MWGNPHGEFIMANQFASISNALGILKIYYAGPIVSQFNDEVPMYKGAEKGKEKYNGLQVNRPIKVLRNPGIGATSDGGNLPAIGKQTTQQAVISAKFNYLRFGVTGPMIKASQGDKGAFVSAMEFEMEQGLIDLKNDVNRQLFWDGEGRLAVLSAAAVATDTITVTGRTAAEDGNKYLEAGMVIDIVNPSTDAYSAQGITINSVSGSTTATLVLSAVVTASASDIIVRSGAYDNEIQGIRTALDGLTTSIYSINRATYPVFQGNVTDLDGAQLSLDSLQRAYNETRRRGGDKISAIFCDFASERYYNKLLVADKRYIGERVKGDGTFTKVDQSYLEFAGVPVTPDKDCTADFYFMPEKMWKKYVLSELEWADETGSYMLAQTGADAFEARLRLFANMFPEKPASMARLTDYIAP